MTASVQKRGPLLFLRFLRSVLDFSRKPRAVGEQMCLNVLWQKVVEPGPCEKSTPTNYFVTMDLGTRGPGFGEFWF